ncbi:CpsD/CapB family tyrosine-protein kinase [Aliiroseovarius subalbicans]|uniref:CpsD/CapB family tyrosine-protein kinase n=1 Tax=Aliiroseovarius subalbicans TaxID=2925840 RepID=UPI001F56C45D|nr:CpsD/CapB family tyrosine-protein kinase [Aliiroseovarius subalbicans]MCI2401150.1 CpsD/CapB family tyrosine-protein kinase [Aliiroseovarius subalbicans]
MEKLQAAIEKARAQRQSTTPVQRTTVSRKSLPEASESLWSDLPPIEITPQLVKKSRLVSYGGGMDAGPYDMLRTRILQQANDNGWKRVALVSPHSACGKSTTAANLVFSFSRQSDLRTMILDLDLRRQGLAKILGQRVKHTMGDVLRGQIPFANHGCRYGDNVALGMNSSPVEHASEILQSHLAREVLDQIEADYSPDIMLFDMPPLMGADDNFGFLKNVDCALLVAEAERTTTDQVDIAERQLAELTNVMGIVLNKSHYTDGAYGYGYGYGYS